MGQSITPAMTVTIVSTAIKVQMLPSVTSSETPPMGLGVAGQDVTLTMSPD